MKSVLKLVSIGAALAAAVSVSACNPSVYSQTSWSNSTATLQGDAANMTGSTPIYGNAGLINENTNPKDPDPSSASTEAAAVQ